MTSQHQYWAENSVLLPRDVSDTAVSVGMPIGLKTDGSEILTPSQETWVTNEATTRANFVAKFAGASAQEASAGEYMLGSGEANKSKVRVNTHGIQRINSLAAGTYVAGVTLLGPAKDTGNALLNTTFKVVTDIDEATHRVTYTPTATNPTWCEAQILTRVFAPVATPDPD